MDERDIFSRTERLLGAEAMEKLRASRVAVFGAGGVGSAVLEALARGGVGAIDVIDNDVVSPSNLNRQLLATSETVGKKKVEAARERILSINEHARVVTHDLFYLPENADALDLSVYDYIVDAIDTTAAKMELIRRTKAAGVPLLSCMGTGNKLDPFALRIDDIEKTSVCPLAKAIRLACRKEGLRQVRVLYSTEPPRRPADGDPTPASTSFVPPVAGFMIASRVIRDLIGENRETFVVPTETG